MNQLTIGENSYFSLPKPFFNILVDGADNMVFMILAQYDFVENRHAQSFKVERLFDVKKLANALETESSHKLLTGIKLELATLCQQVDYGTFCFYRP